MVDRAIDLDQNQRILTRDLRRDCSPECPQARRRPGCATIARLLYEVSSPKPVIVPGSKAVRSRADSGDRDALTPHKTPGLGRVFP